MFADWPRSWVSPEGIWCCSMVFKGRLALFVEKEEAVVGQGSVISRDSLQWLLMILPTNFKKKFSLFLAVLGLLSTCCCMGLLWLWRVGAPLQVWCVVFSLQRLLMWQCQALEHRLGSCVAETSLLHGMWDLPRPGIEPMSPALVGGFFTTEPPGKPRTNAFLPNIYSVQRTQPLGCRASQQRAEAWTLNKAGRGSGHRRDIKCCMYGVKVTLQTGWIRESFKRVWPLSGTLENSFDLAAREGVIKLKPMGQICPLLLF